MIILYVSILSLFALIFTKKITLGIWSINVFKSNSFLINPPNEDKLKCATLTARNVKDVSAEFIADPFIILHNSTYYMFFEVLDKSTGKGIIALASSNDGEKWDYKKIVLREAYHLSYPYVFEDNGNFYMIPESCESEKVLLYKARNFPYEWERVSELIDGEYVDSSVFRFDNKWWMLAGLGGKLHLFFSNQLEGEWIEHPKSPLIINNNKITRPAGRVIVEDNEIYRYTQDGEPNYGSAVRVFNIKVLTETEYLEEELNLVLKGTHKNDWRKDGMHSIDQLKIQDNKWIVAVDGHKLIKRSYILWKLDGLYSKYFSSLLILPGYVILQNFDDLISLINI
jgi:hypothetical protein